MNLLKTAAVGAIALSMTATSAMAAQPTGPAAALAVGSTAPVKNVRTATTLRHGSNQSDGDSPVVGYVLAALVGAGIIAATIAGTDNDNNYKTPASPG